MFQPAMLVVFRAKNLEKLRMRLHDDHDPEVPIDAKVQDLVVIDGMIEWPWLKPARFLKKSGK